MLLARPHTTENTISQQRLWWCLFGAIVLAYCCFLAPYGIDNNDTGFILGLAHQVFSGSKLYNEIIYVRPPVSPILHSFVFHDPFSYAPVLIDRLFSILQIATYSLLSALIVQKLLQWSLRFTVFVACLIFLFSAHSFPQMGWHTTDGIFFSVLAIYFLYQGFSGSRISMFSSAAFAILAAGAKQPFYLTPVLIVLLLALKEKKVRSVIQFGLYLASALLLFLLCTSYFGSLSELRSAITSQTTLDDLLLAGVQNYLIDLISLKRIVVAVSVGVIIKYLDQLKYIKSINVFTLPITIWIILIAIGKHYYSATTWSNPTAIYDSIFVITLLYCFAEYVLAIRDEKWPLLIALHGIAWASSISWGYQTTALYAAPSIITLALMIEPLCKKYRLVKIIALVILPFSLAAFTFGHRYYYSMEGLVLRKDSTAEMSEISESFRFIKVTHEQVNFYKNLLAIINQFEKAPYVVMPNVSLIHTITKETNPLGIDWLLNAEVGHNFDKVENKLNNSVSYAIVFDGAVPPPTGSEKFGSDLTIYVGKKWRLLKTCGKFRIFSNPQKNVKENINCS